MGGFWDEQDFFILLITLRAKPATIYMIKILNPRSGTL
jgi:hypothetical protein